MGPRSCSHPGDNLVVEWSDFDHVLKAMLRWWWVLVRGHRHLELHTAHVAAISPLHPA